MRFLGKKAAKPTGPKREHGAQSNLNEHAALLGSGSCGEWSNMAILDNFVAFLETSGFIPHGYCMLWRWDLVLMHAGSDILIAVSYLSIPFFIYKVLQARTDVKFRAIPVLFACFIAACALTHIFGLMTMWYPLYQLQGVFKLFCAVISVMTAFMVWRIYPSIITIPSPDQMNDKTRMLEAEVRRRELAEAELLQANMALLEIQTELEERVESRTQDLQKANEELERFAYIASHDLRAPLRALLTIPTWLRESLQEQYGEIGEDIEIDLEEMEVQSRRMDSLLTDLLTYAQIGQANEMMDDIDITERTEEAAKLAGLPESFKLTVARGLPLIKAVPTEFDLILRNLISNAVKHHDRDSGNISVNATREGDRVSIEVTDDGPGIPESYAQKVFEMFSTLRPRDEVEGSGMGLAMVKKIVERMGCGVSLIQSDRERGATFRFQFPAATHT